jgi:hypothetical protein
VFASDGPSSVTQLTLSTARYQNPVLARHPAAKIRTTIGPPRFRLPYQLAGNVQLIAPYGIPRGLPPEEFTALYRRRLDQIGIDRVRDRLLEVAAAAGTRELVLLCYEDVRAGLLCHRQVFANWWFEQTGEEVPELDEAPSKVEPG